MKNEKYLAKIMKLMENKKFDSLEEVNEYLSKLNGKISEVDTEENTDAEDAFDLIAEAYEVSDKKGKLLVKKALKLDPDNMDAYNYLASIEKDVLRASKLYLKAIKLGEKTLGKAFFEEEKGHFWGMLETRPYMRAKMD